MNAPDAALGPLLIALARAAIAQRLQQPCPALATDHPALHALGASFVTLTLKGQLRGCIGQLEATRSLQEDVRHNAIAAAFHDPRFAPLSPAEWSQIAVEVSVLGPTHYTPCATRADCLALIEPFEDGVIFASGARRATFLPQVWEQLPDAEQFIDHLLAKAGLPPQHWPADMRVGLYRVTAYHEPAS